MTAATESILDTIAPKSDQLNADDLIAGPITVKVLGVRRATPEQPVAISIEGRKPYMPCKSMRRVLVAAWGDNPRAWIGRQLTLYCDPTVAFGGVKVGGIRIAAMSHLSAESVSFMLTTTRSKRSAFVVKRLSVPELRIANREPEPAPTPDPEPGDAAELEHREAEAREASAAMTAKFLKAYSESADMGAAEMLHGEVKEASLTESDRAKVRKAAAEAVYRIGKK